MEPFTTQRNVTIINVTNVMKKELFNCLKGITFWLVWEYPDSDNNFKVSLIFKIFQPGDTDQTFIMNKSVWKESKPH